MMRFSRISLVVCSVVIAVGVQACSSDLTSSGASSSSGSSGSSGGPGTPSCYLRQDKTFCECLNQNDDSNRPAADWTKVSACNSSTAGGPLSCTADTKVDGETTQCGCSIMRCEKYPGSPYASCNCGERSGDGEVVSTCTDYEWCCAADDGSGCHCGEGSYGSACANEEHTVSKTSCSLSQIHTAKDKRTSCDGLKFTAPPPPSPPSSSGGSSGDPKPECTSDSQCSSGCSSSCYRCRSGDCICGRKGVSGACLY